MGGCRFLIEVLVNFLFPALANEGGQAQWGRRWRRKRRSVMTLQGRLIDKSLGGAVVILGMTLSRMDSVFSSGERCLVSTKGVLP